jgi:hypothetical protein
MKKIKDYKDKLEWMRNLKKYSSYFQNDKFLNNIEIIKKYINSFVKSPTTAEYRYLELLCDLCSLYDDNIQEKLIEYKNESKTSIKVKIRYGDARQEKFIESLKCKPKPIPNSWTMISYWTKKGYTEDEAVVLRGIKQSKASKNAAKKRKENNNYKGESPLSILYWTKLGYTPSEAELLRQPFLYKCKNTLSRYIETHGEILGTKIFNDAKQSRKEKIIKKYGSLVTTSHTSKESLKVLVKLYKKIRKNGILKSDIVWGISKNKEFVLTDFETNKSYFYDFVIKSKKTIIEYNNSFWHPREDKEWKGILDYDELLQKDKIKKELAFQRGYQLYYIWEDDNIEEKINELFLEVIND